MKDFLNTMLFTIFLSAIVGVGIFVGYRAVIDTDTLPIYDNDAILVYANVDIAAFSNDTAADDVATDYSETAQFMPGAVIRFEHYHANSNNIDAWEMEIPHALIGRTSSCLQTIFPMWSIDNYDETGATLRREAPPIPRQAYLVSSTAEGFIAVFFDDEIGGPRLKGVTDISIYGLPEIEIERLRAGIVVHGEDRLMRLLEDLGS